MTKDVCANKKHGDCAMCRSFFSLDVGYYLLVEVYCACYVKSEDASQHLPHHLMTFYKGWIEMICQPGFPQNQGTSLIKPLGIMSLYHPEV